MHLYFKANELYAVVAMRFGRLGNLILCILSGSFIQEQTLLYLLVPLCFKKHARVDPPHVKETKELDHKICGTFSQGKTWDIRQGGRDLGGGY